MSRIAASAAALLDRAEYERKKEAFDRPRRVEWLGPAVPLAICACGVLIETGATAGDWMPDAVRLSLLAGPTAVSLIALGWFRIGSRRAIREAALVCSRCARPLLLNEDEEEALLATGLCPRCGLRTFSDATAPATERRLPPMTALGER